MWWGNSYLKFISFYGLILISALIIFVLLPNLAYTATGRWHWDRELPPYDTGNRPDVRSLRTLIHMHSIYSWDACDKKPISKKGVPNEKCLQRFRRALCQGHVDVVFLSEHKKTMAFTEFNQLLNLRAGDEVIKRDGFIEAAIQNCNDGHRVVVFPGAENKLMPIGLFRHPEPIDGDLYKAYSGADAIAVERFRKAGALVAIPHMENFSHEYLRGLKADLLEIYNLHANLSSLLELRNPFDIIRKLYYSFLFFSDRRMASDLVFLVFFKMFEENLKTWAQVAHDTPMTIFFGTDSHENSFSFELPDEERTDGYRRTMRWFSNIVNVRNEINRESIMAALKSGDSFSTFEVLGTPKDFDFYAESNGKTYRMGSQVPSTLERVTLVASFPRFEWWGPLYRTPKLLLRILRATSEGWVEVKQSTQGPIRFDVPGSGVYRAEVRMVPSHLEPYLNEELGLIENELPWVFSNAIVVQ